MIKKYIKRLYYRLKSNYTTEHLIEMGLKVGRNFNRMHDVILDPSHCWHIKIGDNVTMAPRVHILAHDASFKNHIGYARIGNVIVGNNVFIGADSVVLPGVTIGDNIVIGANSTVTKDLESNFVFAGTPAKKICSIDDFLSKSQFSSSPKYEEDYTIRNTLSKSMKEKMFNDLLHNKYGFVR